MVTVIYPNFTTAFREVERKLANTGRVVELEKWQSINVKDTPRGKMFEALNVYFQVHIPEIKRWVDDIKPNVEWAYEHYKERVSGLPLNPPPSHRLWPFAQKNNAEFGGNNKFSHTYPERIWPKYAGNPGEEHGLYKRGTAGNPPRRGIRYEYGDLDDLINLLHKDPLTRQAFLPIWFPEDTGAAHGERVPCTIGYHFIRRHGFLHVTYYIRSCDFFRHFRDDVYLCLMLAQFILDSLSARDRDWSNVRLGIYTMHIVNLHIFEPEINQLKK